MYEVNADDTAKYLLLIAVDYQKKQIRSCLTTSQLQTLSFASPYIKELFNESWDELYDAEFLNSDEADLYCGYPEFYIYQENMEIPYYIPGRWYDFMDYFKHPEYLEIIKAHRKAVNHLAVSLGCNGVIYCSDQTVSSRIWEKMYMPSSSLLMYAKTGAFIEPEEKNKLFSYNLLLIENNLVPLQSIFISHVQ